MRFIHKRPEPPPLTAWKQTQPVPTSSRKDWKRLQAPLKPELMAWLLQDQGYLCCYCESRIYDLVSGHIEHLTPRGEHPERMFDFDHLLASCNGKAQQPDTADQPPGQHCGHKRKRTPLFPTPLQPHCADLLAWQEEQVHPAPQLDAETRTRVKETLHKTLKLGHRFLNLARKEAIESMRDEVELSLEDLDRLIQSLDQPDSNGQFTPYRSAIEAALRQERAGLMALTSSTGLKP